MKKFLLLSILGTLILMASCDKNEDFITDGSFDLEFSLDTLTFDTVFTELGSATRALKVYNRENRPIKIPRIYIDGGESSAFRLNIDGIPGNEAEDVIVWANDSIYIFGEVTVDPDQDVSISPFVIEDKIIFDINEKTQSVVLEAWGQNANYFPSRFNKGVAVLLSCDNETIVWDDPKPYVIYGEVFIDSCLLEIAAGTQIYVHGGVAQNETFGGIFNDGIIYTLENGSININGTLEEPVVIQGDRLEQSYLDDPGQWQGIILGKGSKGNRFEYTTVRNSIFGVYVDSTAELTIKNSQFYNTASSGIIGFNGTITAENCLVYNNATTSVLLTLGGNYDFTYCTFASYGVDASALGLQNFFCYDGNLSCAIFATQPLVASFRNSIIFGSRSDEVIFNDVWQRSQEQIPEVFSVSFENCIVKVEDLLEQDDGAYANFFVDYCDPCINGTRDDLLFLDASGDDYHLDSLSIAIGQAVAIPDLEIDLEGNVRDSEPDVGCFERID